MARVAAVVGCVFLSGLAGLIYQIAWVEQFSLVFGSAAIAVVAVVAAFMSGMAIGAGAAGKAAERLDRPLRAFAVLQLLTALAALTVPIALHATAALQVHLLAGSSYSHSVAAAFSFVASLVILILPTSLIGAALPVVVRSAVRSDAQIGRRVGLLYGFNTLGSGAGALLAGYLLIPRFGLTFAVGSAVALNLIVCAVTLALAQSENSLTELAEKLTERSSAAQHRWVLVLVLASGAVFFVAEVFWIRLLTHLFAGTLYAFSILLATILSGLGLGSAMAGIWAKDRTRSLRGFVVAQFGFAISSVLGFGLADRLPGLLSSMSRAWVPDLPLRSLAVSLVVLPSSMFAGAIFPLAVRMLEPVPVRASRATGRVLAWGTGGAVIGCYFAGLVLLPALRFAGTISALAATSLAIALIAAVWGRPRQPLAIGGAALGIAILALLPASAPDNLIGYSPLTPSPVESENRYFGVGSHSTVLLGERASGWLLSADGLPESFISPRGAIVSQLPARWLSLLPIAARPKTRSMLVVGLGGGVTLEEVPTTVEEIDVLELEKEVVRAIGVVAENRRKDPLADSRVRVHLTDARSHLRLADRHYDAVISQPSHPWSAGSAQLYTREFFSLVGTRLTKDGVFVQWIGLRFVDEALMRTLLATLSDVFAHVEAYLPRPGGAVLFLASQAPLTISLSASVALRHDPELWASVGVSVLEDLLMARRLDPSGSKALGLGSVLNTDGHNVLKAGSSRVLGAPLGARGVLDLFSPFDPLPDLAGTLNSSYIVRRLVQHGERARARLVAQTISSPSARRAAMGVIRLAAGEGRLGIRALNEALETEPNADENLQNLVLLHRKALTGGQVPEGLKRALESQSTRSLVESWMAAASENWIVVEGLDSTLAAIHASEPMYLDAVRLRARWRVATGDPDLARQALTLIEPLMGSDSGAGFLLMRAECAAIADMPETAIQSLVELIASEPRGARQPAVRARASEVLEFVDGSEEMLGYDEVRTFFVIETG